MKNEQQYNFIVFEIWALIRGSLSGGARIVHFVYEIVHFTML